MGVIRIPDTFLYGTPALIFTALLAFFLKRIGMDKYQIFFTLILFILFIILISICGMIQNYYKVRIIPFVIVDLAIKYLLGLFVGTISIGSVIFSVWFVFQLIDFIDFIL